MDESQQVGAFRLQDNMAAKTFLTIALAVMTFTLPGAMIMMCITNLVFFDAERTSFSSADWYEVILLLLSILALLCLSCKAARNSTETVVVHQRFLNFCPTAYGFLGLLSVLAVVSLVTTLFYVVAIASCFGEDADTSAVLRFILNVIKCCFLICQTLFFLLAKDFRCMTKSAMSCVMVLVSTNVCLCIRCLSDAVQQTMVNSNNTNYQKGYGSAFCKNQSIAVTKGFRIADRYFYTMILFYCLYSLEILCGMWNLMGSRGTSIQAVVAESLGYVSEDGQEIQRARPIDEHTSLLRSHSQTSAWSKIKSIYCLDLCRYSFIPASIIAVGFLIGHVTLDITRNEFDLPKNNTIHKDTVFVWTQTFFENFMAGAGAVGLLLVHKEIVNRKKLYTKHVLLVVAACVCVLLVLIESMDAIANMIRHPRTEGILLFLFRTVFHFLGLLFQTPFVIKSSDLPNQIYDSNKFVYIRGILWFLACTNLQLSLVNMFLVPTVLRYAWNVPHDSFGRDNWAITVRVLFPAVAFYRLQSTLLCFENIRKLESRRCQRSEENVVA